MLINPLGKAVYLKKLVSGYNRNQLLFILDAGLINAAIILTTGVFISGYIVFLKGSDFLVGILNSSINWASIAGIFSFLIYERLKSRKKMLIAMVTASRLLICSIIFIPLIPVQNEFLLYIVGAMVIAGNILWGIYAIGWMVWMAGVSPKESRNSYIYTRMLFLRISFTVVTIIMGFVLDLFHKSYAGFLIVFCTSLIFFVIDFIILVNIDETGNNPGNTSRPSVAMFLEPLKNRPYMQFLLFTFFFYLFLSMSTSYTPLYLIRYLNFDYSFISIINVISYIVLIIFTGLWRKVEARKGMEFVFGLTSVFVVAEVFMYSFLVRERFYLLFLAPVVSGIGNSGFNVCIFNFRYELMPDHNRTVYEGWFGAVFGLSSLIAPVIGGVLLERLPVLGNALFRHGNFQLLYLFSSILAGAVVLLFHYSPGFFRTLTGKSAGSSGKAVAG